MEKPILDPPIPYVGPICGGRFSPSKMVRIRGTVPSVAYRFNINLQCGPETVPQDDIAVQVSVHILDGYISLNSLQNRIWGEEQRVVILPIKRAETFEIILLCNFGQYKVAINGCHYCDFPQRIHYDRITHLAIDGDVSIIRISYESSARGVAGVPSVASAPSASAPFIPMPFPAVQDDADDFELIDSTKPAPAMRGPPPVGFSQPPPYSSIVPGNQGAFLPAGPPGGAPNSAPYPTGGVPHSAPYPIGGVPNMTPYPTGIPGVIGTSPYPPPGAPGIPPPPPGAPVPLNAASSNFRPVKRTNTRKYLTYCGAAVLIILLIVIVVVTKSKRDARRNQSNYSNYNTDNNY